MADQRTLADAGEFEVIDLISEALAVSPSAAVTVGLGDDAAELHVAGGRVVACCDQVVEGRHFRRDWSSAGDVGRKAAARAMSDIAAMGATPTALLVGLGAPADTPVSWVVDLARGIAQEAAVVGAAVIGGDTVDAPVVFVSVTALGEVAGDPVLRSGARPGDSVCITGELGASAAGLAVLSRGHRSPRSLVAAHRVPQPPYAAGVAAAAAGATSMIDVSDGLLADLGHIARQSGVTISIDTSALSVDDELSLMARNLGLDVWEWVLRGGEDHALVATFPPGVTPPPPFHAIGVVQARAEGDDDAAVLVDGQERPGAAGHEHFRP